MKKIVFLGLLIISGSLVAVSNPVENENGHLAHFENLSEQGKQAYTFGRKAAEEGKVLKKDWKNITRLRPDYRDGFSLGYFHGKVVYLNEKFAK